MALQQFCRVIWRSTGFEDPSRRRGVLRARTLRYAVPLRAASGVLRGHLPTRYSPLSTPWCQAVAMKVALDRETGPGGMTVRPVSLMSHANRGRCGVRNLQGTTPRRRQVRRPHKLCIGNDHRARTLRYAVPLQSE